MLFSSLVFLLLFLPIVLALYFLSTIGHRQLKNVVLLVASLLFYAWGEKLYLLILLSSILVNHYCGYAIYRLNEHKQHSSRLVLIGSVIFNLGVLAFFKYFNFVADNLQELSHTLFSLQVKRNFTVHLPIGISFFTFQAMSYVVDVYRKKTAPQDSILNTALYISLFPQLIAGPIIRYRDVAAQLLKRSFNLDDLAYGVERFIIGLGKKVILANTLAQFADFAFEAEAQYLTTPVAWLGVIAYTLQIYFDFSGYSDMAIGLGRMFGFTFLENFNYPYISKSIREFWRRWHISLSNWFRDYLYIPLGGNRKGERRTYINLIIVFFLCGLWHGAGWTFIVWGLYHGSFLALERTHLGRALERIPAILQRLYTILVVVVGWIFFRAESIEHAGLFLKRLIGISENAKISAGFLERYNSEFLTFLPLAILFCAPILPWIRKLSDNIKQKGVAYHSLSALGYFFLTSVLLFSIIKLAAGTYNPFIYFQF